jgi:hypothetical protein
MSTGVFLTSVLVRIDRCRGILYDFSAAFVNNGYFQSLSFQQFISCNKRNLGCDGGNLQVGSLYAALNSFGGISRLDDYEFTDYSGKTTESCDLSEATIPVAVAVSTPGIVAGLGSPATFHERLELFKQALEEKPVAMVMKSSCMVRMLHLLSWPNKRTGETFLIIHCPFLTTHRCFSRLFQTTSLAC